jgi:hypothetical protein
MMERERKWLGKQAQEKKQKQKQKQNKNEEPGRELKLISSTFLSRDNNWAAFF